MHVEVKKIIGFMIILNLTACEVGPDFKAPAPPPTEQYTPGKEPTKTVSTPGTVSASKSQTYVLQERIPADWWKIFGSSEIDDLVKQGLVKSPTLAASKATLEEAQATLKVEIGNLLFPAINMTGYGARFRTSTLILGGNSPNTTFNLYNTAFSMTYLLDVFGGSRRTIESYRAQADYNRYEFYGTELTLTSNIVTTSIAIASLQDQIAATKALVVAEKQILDIVKTQYREGGASEQDVLLQETTLAQTEATLPPLEKALEQSTHSLAALVGKYTSEQSIPKLHLDELNLPKDLPLSLPSCLVEQRPDIQASEALMHVASANIGVAVANMLPQVPLSAQYGWLSTVPSELFTNMNNIWNYVGNYSQPVFHGGALWYARQEAIDAYKVAANNYQQTVLNAFQNVSDSLSAIQNDAKEYNREYNANYSAGKSLSIIRQQYKLGGVNYLTVLNAEAQYEQTVLALIKAKTARYSDTAALYQALGGGWWNTPTTQGSSMESAHG